MDRVKSKKSNMKRITIYELNKIFYVDNQEIENKNIDIYELARFLNDNIAIDNVYFFTDNLKTAENMNKILGDGNIYVFSIKSYGEINGRL